MAVFLYAHRVKDRLARQVAQKPNDRFNQPDRVVRLSNFTQPTANLFTALTARSISDDNLLHGQRLSSMGQLSAFFCMLNAVFSPTKKLGASR